MKLSRRNLFTAASAAAVAPGLAAAQAVAPSRPFTPPRGYRPVRTLNGWTLPYKLKNGVKEFHLVAEEIEHEFAPGCRAKVLGLQRHDAGPDDRSRRRRSRAHLRHQPPARAHHHALARHHPAERHGRRRRPDASRTSSRARPTPTSSRCSQHGTHMYHPHADEMVQMALGMMGMFIIHPRAARKCASIATTASCCTTGRCIRARIVRIRRSCRTSTCGPSTPRSSRPSTPWSRAPASACACASATCRCGITRSTCTACSSRHRIATAGAGRARSGGAKSPKSSASARRATSNSSPCQATGPCTATCRITR